ncbi:GDSL esterase/lipase [Phytophthora cinnamomi]|uniref:GDSL esterase/lipase n=1 Tax=Phytophthora cinnamomi TaxID=4785 RepID=UPI003559DD05|nr:GDSL esterase/lipase [Phytophthora cinnamomi]
MVASLFIAVALAWSVTTIAENSGDHSHSRPVLLFLGDSLTEKGTDPATQGWVTLLQSRYTRSAGIVVRGLSGYNTKWFVKDVVPLVDREIWTKAYATPSLVIVWLGANDAALWNGSNSETHVPIGDYKENLIKIISGLWVAAPTAHFLLITPPHVNDSARVEIANERTNSKRGLVDRSNAMTKKYARACVEASETLNVTVLDLNSYFNAMSEAGRNALLVDGLHFNQDGNKVVDEQLRNKIAAEFPALDKALQVWQFPPASTWVSTDPWVADSKSQVVELG